MSVFIVDDHALMRAGLRALLQAQGMTVVGEAAEPQAALQDILRLEPAVLLLDIRLNGRCGLDLLARLRQRGSTAQVVLLSMSEQTQHVAQAWRLGARAYVLKGSASSVLLQGIQAAVDGARYLDPDLRARQGVIEQVAAAGDPLAPLSDREREIMLGVVSGHNTRQIAEQTHLSVSTVDTYRSRLMAKLGVQDLTGLVRLAVRVGMLDSALV
jgi:two-component system, NarL family, invasion response regulator UvrY